MSTPRTPSIPFRLAAASLVTLTLIACAKAEKAPDTTAAMATPVPAAPAPFALADAAGKWAMRAVPVSGTDTAATLYTLTATADTSGWSMAFPSGVKVPLHVTVSGDSAIIKTGSFASQRRKGVKVVTEGTLRLQGGKLVGMTTAHYSKGADSVITLRTEGMKAP